MSYDCSCAVDCTDACALPIVTFSEGCPEFKSDGIVKLLVACSDQPFTTLFPDPFETDQLILDTFTDGLKNELITRVQNTTDVSVDPTVMRELIICGDKPAPEEIIRPGDCCYDDVVVARTHTLNFDVEDLTIQNYEFLRDLQKCVSVKLKVWFVTKSGEIYGGQDGINASVSQAINVIGRGEETKQLYQYTLTWKALCDPERHPYPFVACDYIA